MVSMWNINLIEPSVLVACPINSNKLYSWELFANSLANLSYSNYEVLLVETDGDLEMQKMIIGFGFNCETLNSNKKMMDKVVDGRNLINEYAIKNDFDYVLHIDGDSILPSDVIERLIEHKKDFITTVMFGLDNKGFPVIVAKEGDEDSDCNLWHFPVDKIDTGVNSIIISGMGCTLLSNKIIKDIKFRCIRDKEGKLKIGEDYCFSLDAIEKDYEPFIDSNITTKHMVRGNWDYDKA